ncbi:hypothetical protein L1787_05510 [Acuticoccus sp. M5D2P5]|uniref:hypothetical protein n=1 Tax=Acuticoccus kalidii TaxID=2910977 RepID=UPI001F4510FE|nr:hypothetical protein [Acuticoccus kalidii]MCF3932871.1 hypothetical protein [Acuticoccus kalidii]
MTTEVNDLLVMLQATVDDEKIFDMSGVTDPDAFKKELREAWEHVFANALCAWNAAYAPEYEETPELIGPEMCRKFKRLSSCWLESFTAAITQIAKRTDLPRENDRDVLFLMLGVLMASWATYLGLRHGKITEAAYSQ